MTALELEQCERFKKIRHALKIKQGELAKELTISQGHASDIENGRKAVSERVIAIISLKYGINENWLRTGNGEMFIQKTRGEQIAEFAADVLKDEEDSFRHRFIEALAELSVDEWEVLEKIVKKITKERD